MWLAQGHRVPNLGLEPNCPAPKRTCKDISEYKWISCQLEIDHLALATPSKVRAQGP